MNASCRRPGRRLPRGPAARAGLRGGRDRPQAARRVCGQPRGGRAIASCSSQADLLDQAALARVLRDVEPTEVYNLAAPSFVPRSWDEPVLTAEFAAVGATSLLEAIREVDPAIRFYQASSSEIFGEPRETPQTETTPLEPLTPYGVAKAYAHFIARQLPPPLRDVHLLRDPLQPRVAATTDRLPAPQGRARRRRDLARPRVGARAR